jgi:hypothetical protein
VKLPFKMVAHPPTHLHDLLEAGTLGRVQHEELPQQVLAVGGYVEGYAVLATQHTLAQLTERGAIERKRAADQRVQNHAE